MYFFLINKRSNKIPMCDLRSLEELAHYTNCIYEIFDLVLVN
jgi:hypothetical protein